MGVVSLFSGPYRPQDLGRPVVPYGNPDPHRFSVLETALSASGYLVLRVRYPGARSREGIKVLVFDVDDDAIVRQGWLDPHFGDAEDGIYPIARFEPTERGWAMAVDL